MPSLSSHKVLASRYSDAVLVNVRVHNGRLFAGFAYFDAGLPDRVTVKSGEAAYSIRVPEAVQKARTFTLMTSPSDSIEFQIVS